MTTIDERLKRLALEAKLSTECIANNASSKRRDEETQLAYCGYSLEHGEIKSCPFNAGLLDTLTGPLKYQCKYEVKE